MKKKVVSLMLVLAMTVSMTACGNKNNAADDANAVEDTEAGTESGSSEEAVAPANYEEVSAELYDKELGDFWAAYQKADEAETVSEKFALEAIAEAKLMESGVMLPLQSKGGKLFPILPRLPCVLPVSSPVFRTQCDRGSRVK
jgi:oligopeptide transport system substrate-binding protein